MKSELNPSVTASFNVTRRLAIISGAAPGIGAVADSLLAARGAKVVLVDWDAVMDPPAGAPCLTGDISDPETVAHYAGEIREILNGTDFKITSTDWSDGMTVTDGYFASSRRGHYHCCLATGTDRWALERGLSDVQGCRPFADPSHGTGPRHG